MSVFFVDSGHDTNKVSVEFDFLILIFMFMFMYASHKSLSVDIVPF